MIPQKWKHFGNMFPCEKIEKNWEKNVHFWGKMETFCIAQETFLMCQVGVGKCMGAIFSNIGSARRLLGGKMSKIGKNGNILWGPANSCDVSGWCWEVYVS